MVAHDGHNRGAAMTLAELANRAALPPRQLRYVLDHGLLPAGRIESRGRGAARTFTDFEAFGIACAAVMLHAGLRQAIVRDCIALLCRFQDGRPRKTADIPLFRAFQATKAAKLEVGDGVNVRLSGTGTLAQQHFDTGWRQVATGVELVDGYEPLIVISINLDLLARLVRS
jgi:hypothetical protein